jgi:glycosyltransferase involved in cell wall biosynthesis
MTKPLRVTFLVQEVNLKSGGGSHHTFNLTATGLADLGHDIRIIALSGSPALDHDAPPIRVTVEEGWDRAIRFGRIRAVAEILRRHEHDTDVFHVFSPAWVPAGGLYRASGRVPTVATLNSYSLWCTNMDLMDGQCQRGCGIVQRTRHAPMAPVRKLLSVPARALEHLTFNWVRHIDHFMPNSTVTQAIYGEAGFDMTRSTMVPALIDFEAIRAMSGWSRPDRPESASPRQALYAGRLAATKGVDVLIEALPRMRSGLHLHVAGDGPERPLLESLARRRGVLDRITFHGWVPNRRLWELLQTVDVFVHPGRWPEPCGRSVQEALALGIPTVVSNIGGPPWLIGDCGRTFGPGDPDDLADQLDALSERYEDALVAAAKGIARAAEFDYRRWLPRLMAVYESVLQRDAAPPSSLVAR